MKSVIWSSGQPIPLNPFIAGLVAHVVKGIVASLKLPEKEVRKIELQLEKGEVMRLEVNDQPVSLENTTGFARQIVGSTLRGLLQPLKGTGEAEHVIIRVEEEKV